MQWNQVCQVAGSWTHLYLPPMPHEPFFKPTDIGWRWPYKLARLCNTRVNSPGLKGDRRSIKSGDLGAIILQHLGSPRPEWALLLSQVSTLHLHSVTRSGGDTEPKQRCLLVITKYLLSGNTKRILADSVVDLYRYSPRGPPPPSPRPPLYTRWLILSTSIPPLLRAASRLGDPTGYGLCLRL